MNSRALPLFLVFWILCALSTHGCTVGPDYVRPTIDAPGNWRDEQGSGPALSKVKWRELFQDPELRKLLDEALRENKDLLLAAARVEEYRARLGVARSDQFPRVNGQVTASREKFTEKGVFPYPVPLTNDFQLQTSLSWELDFFGKYRRATEAARAELLAQEESRAAVLITLISDVATAYLGLRDLDRELEIAKEAVATREQSLSLTQSRGRNGASSEVEVQLARSELAATVATVANLELQIAQQENSLSILLGRNPGPIARGKSLEDQVFPPEVPAGLPSELLQRRPDIKQAEQILIAANARIGVAKAAFFPSISLTGIFGTEASQLSDLLSSGSGVWQIGGGVLQPIFEGGKNRGNYEAAQAVQKEALLTYVKTIQQAFREVNDALVSHRKMREARLSLSRQVKAAEKALELSLQRYRMGVSSYIEVLDSQRAVLSARTTLTQVMRSEWVAVVQLYRALGGGWE